MRQENKEIIAGVILSVLLGGLLLFVHSKRVLDKDVKGFVLYAQFTKADGLMNGADVRLGGIKVGQVTHQELNGRYAVRVRMSFPKEIALSEDTSALIETDGLLGAKHIELVPGGSDEDLKSGDEIYYTQDALILTELLDKVNAFMREKKKDDLTPEEMAALQPSETTQEEVEQ